MEFFICLVISAVITRMPAALSDYNEARKAAKAGAWDHLDKMRDSRDGRAERRANWAERIYNDWQARDRGEKRPGMFAWLSEVWHGAWEDALERRAARRGVREPFDPATPTARERAWKWATDKAADRKRRKAEAADRPTTEKQGPWWRRWAGKVTGWWSNRRGVEAVPGPEASKDEPEPMAWRQKCLWPVGDRNCGVDAAEGDIYCTPHAAEADRQQKQDQPATEDTGGNTDNEEEPMTAPAQAAAAAEEVQTNEAARRALQEMSAGAAELAEAAAMAERARAKIAANAQACADGMAGIAFDSGATAAVANINDVVSNATLSEWSSAADEIKGAADSGLKSLEKYRDAEDTVASNRIDARTLEPTQS